MAPESSRQIGIMKFGKRDSIGMQIEGQEVSIPVSAFRLLVEAISGMADGKTVAMISVEKEISPQEAAALLNVSRPFASKLFDEGTFPSRKVDA